jgi:hypothetical protein
MLTCGVHEVLGPAWQRPGRGIDVGRLGEVGWVRSAVEIDQLRGETTGEDFTNLNSFSN